MTLIYTSPEQHQFKYMLQLVQKEIAIHTEKNVPDEFIMKRLKKNRNYIIFNQEPSKTKAEKSLKQIGFISFLIKKNRLYLDYIALEQEAQHCGFGKKIIERLEQEALKLQLKLIYLDVLHNNQPAIGAYEKYGFVKTKSRRNHYRMEKQISIEKIG